ncbi:MAG: type IV secretory system conjugative DNA transfer family protein [bacterium]|nr:type IV secretory system conjugative DNA transfer family protein [bacterium]
MIQFFELTLLNLLTLLFKVPINVLIFGGFSSLIILFSFSKNYFFSNATVKGGVIFLIFCLMHYVAGLEILSALKDLRDSLSLESDNDMLFQLPRFIEVLLIGQNPIKVHQKFLLIAFIMAAGIAAAVKSGLLDIAEALSKIHNLFSLRNHRPRRSDHNEFGSGDLACQKEIKRWLSPSTSPCHNILYAKDLKGADGVIRGTHNLRINRDIRNRHILTVAKTGSGKTTRFILPLLYGDCLDRTCSTIVIDSKPEMWNKLSHLTQEHNPNKRLLLFNPLDTLRSLSWNILSEIKSDTDAKLIANSIISATDNPNSRSDSPFFRNNSLKVLNAIMVGILHSENEQLSMPYIHSIIQSGNHKIAAWLENHPEAIRTARTFVDLVHSGSQNADTVMSELGMRLAAWDLKAIRSTTALSELKLSTLIEEPTLFILELRESELEMLRPLANVIVTEILRYLTKQAEELPEVSLPRPVGLVIDEFASSLGRLPDIHVKLNTLRSRNVSIVASIQSLSQIHANYGEDADSVIAGFNTKIFLPTLDLTDAEWASRESGQMTIRYSTETRKTSNSIFTGRGMGGKDAEQEQVQQRPVLTPDEIGRPSNGVGTFFFPGMHPFQGHLVPYFEVPKMRRDIEGFKNNSTTVKVREKPIENDDRWVNIDIIDQSPTVTPVSSQEKTKTTTTQPLSSVAPKGLPPGFNHEALKDSLQWNEARIQAKTWWLGIEKKYLQEPNAFSQLSLELLRREATIDELFLAFVQCKSTSLTSILSHVDFLRARKKQVGMK